MCLSACYNRFNGDVTTSNFPKKTYHGETVNDIHHRGCIVPVGTSNFILIGGTTAKLKE